MSDDQGQAVGERKERKRKKYNVWKLTVITLCIALACSVAHKVFFGNSISSYLSQKLTLLIVMRRIVSCEAVLKVSEAVGLLSLPIAGIYASLQREELGLKYEFLLKSTFPEYNLFVLIHFFAVIGCFWLSSVGALESALISLFIVLLGFPLQWKAFCYLILFPEKRAKIAVRAWKRKLNLYNVDITDEPQFNDICTLAQHCLNSDDIYSKEALDTFSYAFLKFASRLNKQQNVPNPLFQILLVWDHLLLQRTNAEQKVIVQQVFQMLSNKEKNIDKLALGMVCAGYVLWINESYVYEGISHDTGSTQTLIRATNEIFQLQRNIFVDNNNLIVHYWILVALFLGWMYALSLNTDIWNLPDDFLRLLDDLQQKKLLQQGNDENQEDDQKEDDRKVLEKVRYLRFASCKDKTFEQAWQYTNEGWRLGSERS